MMRFILRAAISLCLAFTVVGKLLAACVDAPAGLVGWWPGQGNGNDVIGSNPGIVSNGVSYAVGEVGQAFNFDGASGSIRIPASASLDIGAGPGLTVECWIKPTDLTPLRPILEWNNGAALGVHLYHSTSWCGEHFPGNLLANIVDTSGNWHPLYSGPGLLTTSNFQHVALTYDKASGAGKLYINGVVVGSANLGSFTPQTGYDLYLGQRPAPESFFYGGVMDEVSLYGRALSQAEIVGIYQAGNSGKCPLIPPFIITQPASQTVTAGDNAIFSVSATGSVPLSYQWRHNGTDVTGATTSTLNLSHVQLSDAGDYSVVVSNLVGTAISSNALLTVNAAVCTNAPAALVSWWAGEENGSDTFGNNPGSVTGGISYSPGRVGQAFNFDGASGAIIVPASSSLNVGLSNGFSVECWIKPSDLNQRHPIVEWATGSAVGVHFYISQNWFGNSGPGNLMANIVEGSGTWHPIYTGPGLLNTNNFQHVGLTYDKASGVGKIYLNGAVVASANLGSFTPQTSYPLYMGQRPWDNSVPLYRGLMDEVSVYAKALSQVEIQAIYNAGPAGKCQSLAPFIVNQPADQTAVVGGNANFSVTAGGSSPLSYQWRHNGTGLNGATASTLNLNNVQIGDAGDYTVVIANSLGSVTSAVAVLTVTTQACVNAPSGLVSWWAADGNGADLTGGNAATVNSGVTYSPGEVGQAFNFDGTSGSVIVPASASLNVGLSNGFTVECWIKPSDLTQHHPIVEWATGSAVGVHFYISQNWFGNSGPGNLMANIVEGAGTWHPVYTAPGLVKSDTFQHVALTYDKGSGVGTLYLDGAVVASANLGSFTPQTGYPLNIGKRPWDNTMPLYAGLMDEVSVYAKALSQAEIQAIYKAGAYGKCQSPSPPFIVNQPVDQTVVAGGNATLSVTAGGSSPLSYQWRHNDVDIAGGTGSSLTWNGAQLSDAGNYAVVVANQVGSITSAVAVLTVTTQACVNAPSGLVSWWAAEGNGSDVIGGNPATVNSGVTYSLGEVGQAFKFDGISGSVTVPAAASLNVGAGNGFTVECWIKPDELSARHPLVEWNSGSSIGVHFYISTSWFGNSGSGDLLANLIDTSGTWHPIFSAPGLLTASSFQHVALTYDKASGVCKLYLNGAVVANENLGTFTPQTSYDLYLGRRPNDTSTPLYSGLMDEVSVYGRALSQAEIQNIYNAAGAGKCHPGGAAASAVPGSIILLPIAAVPNGYQISFSGTVGKTYQVERASNPNGPWTSLTSVSIEGDGIGKYIDTNAHPQAAFYRIAAR